MAGQNEAGNTEMDGSGHSELANELLEMPERSGEGPVKGLLHFQGVEPP